MCVYVCIGGRDTLKLSDFIAETCVRTFLEDSTAALPSPRLHIESTFGLCLAKPCALVFYRKCRYACNSIVSLFHLLMCLCSCVTRSLTHLSLLSTACWRLLTTTTVGRSRAPLFKCVRALSVNLPNCRYFYCHS